MECGELSKEGSPSSSLAKIQKGSMDPRQQFQTRSLRRMGNRMLLDRSHITALSLQMPPQEEFQEFSPSLTLMVEELIANNSVVTVG